MNASVTEPGLGDAARRRRAAATGDTSPMYVGAVGRPVDDAHAVGPEERDPVAAARCRATSSLHRGRRRAALDDAAARDDDGGHAGGRGLLGRPCAARSGLSATTTMSGRSGSASRLGIARLAVQLRRTSGSRSSSGSRCP